MSVTWVLNGSSKYEVSSKAHLLQIMTQGTLYTDSGTPPTDYWSDDYEQTADIDLEFDTNITPIGASSSDNFNGTYDGGNHSISNWSLDFDGVGPNYMGLFGHMNGGILENIKLAGVWTVSGISSWVGFLIGQALSATLRNIECTFDEGTMIDVNASYVGAFCGETFFANTYGITVRGFIDLNTFTAGFRGGVIGRIRNGNHVGLRNAAVLTNGISGATVGGIVGELGGDSNLTYCMNSMVGDITGTTCGGICGYNQRGGGTDPFNTLVNSMNGNITGTNHAGGVIGHTFCDSGNLSLFDVTNYITGDIVSTNGTSGGLLGLVTQASSNTCSISNSVVAMNGSSDEAVVGSAGTGAVATVSTKIDASFGFTYTTATYGSTSDVFTGTTSTLLPELSYIPLVFTDDVSNSYEYELVFGNIGGNATYSQYTHAIISKDDIAGPYSMDFDLTGNTTEYLTYVDIGSSCAFTDASLTILDSSAQTVKDYAGNTLFPLVQWVLDSNSKYEISSKDHLLQLMNEGTLYANTGSVPPDWILSSFIQTVDIDLEGDSTNIVPIGDRDPIVGFRGEYDGNGFTISNWVYVDPNYPGASSDSGEYNYIGLFGSIQSTAVVKNVRMAGVCSISGFRSFAGFLTGLTLQTTVVYNVEIDLSPGSFITQSNDSTSVPDIGGVIGAISGPGPFVAITLKGELEIPTTGTNVGGIVGSVANSNITLFRNLATFTSPLNGARVGGIVGRLRYSNIYKVMNAMSGDMNGSNTAGGIAGDARQNNSSQVFSEFVNSMRGTITGTSLSAHVSGVVGYLDQEPGGTVHSLFNYMSGDVTQPENIDRTGGLVSRGDSNTNILTSLNAMNGNVRMPTVGDPISSVPGAEANINLAFGLTYEVERNITTTPITGLPTDPGTGLPIFDLTATDPDGVVHTFDFIFGNLPREFNQLQIQASGAFFNMAELQIFTLENVNIAMLGTASAIPESNQASNGIDGNIPSGSTGLGAVDLSGSPTWILDLDREYTLSEINRIIFHNVLDVPSRATGSVVTLHSSDGGEPEQIAVLTADRVQEFVITPAPEFLLPTPRVASILATIVEVPGASTYRITIRESPSGPIRTAHTGTSTGDVVIGRLNPETTYTLQLLADTGGGLVVEDTETVTTLQNSADSYDRNTFGSDGRFDVSSLDTAEFSLLDEVINEVFTTGDRLELSLGQRSSTVSFVRRGESVSTDESILAPFNTASGSGQGITMNLSDSSTVQVAYDETDNSLTIGGTDVQVGESIVIDGKKLTALDI